MSELAEGMVRDSLNAVVRRDIELARSVLIRTIGRQSPRSDFSRTAQLHDGGFLAVFQAFELILVAKNLERVADHATNIAEDVIYMVEGHDVRHATADRR